VVVGASELIVARLFAGDDVGPILEMPQELVALVLDGVRARGAIPSKPAEEKKPRAAPSRAAASRTAAKPARSKSAKRR
jgi:hypothetical protein